jgi:hypothetical protein
MAIRIHSLAPKAKTVNHSFSTITPLSLGHPSKYSDLNLIVPYGERNPSTRYKAIENHASGLDENSLCT